MADNFAEYRNAGSEGIDPDLLAKLRAARANTKFHPPVRDSMLKIWYVRLSVRIAIAFVFVIATIAALLKPEWGYDMVSDFCRRVEGKLDDTCK